MARIKIDDLPGDMVVSREEMRKITGGYVDKEIMLGSAIPDNPFGYDGDDSGTGDTSGTDSDDGNIFPDVTKIPPPPGPTVPIPYPNISSK